MSKATQWIPVLLPKDVVEQLLKSYISSEGKRKSSMEILKNLQKKVKEIKLFEGMNNQQIVEKLHKQRKRLLKEEHNAYIDHTA